MTTYRDEFQGDDALTLGVNWDEYDKGFHKDSGAAIPDSTGYNVAQWAANLDSDDQYAFFRVGTTYGGGRVGPCIFMPAGLGIVNVETGPFYMFVITGTDGRTAVLQRKENLSATFTTIATTTLTFDAAVSGTKLEVIGWVNGGVVELRGLVNDKQVISGRDSNPPAAILTHRRAGMYASGPGATNLRIAAWQAGDRVEVATPVPPAPTGVAVTAPSPLAAFIQWMPSAGADTYQVFFQVGGPIADGSAVADGSVTAAGPLDPAGWVLVGTTAGTNFTHTGLTEDVAHFYVVKAVNASGSSPASDTVGVVPYFRRGTPWRVLPSGKRLFRRGVWNGAQIVPILRHYVHYPPVPPEVIAPSVTSVTTSRTDQTVTVTATVAAGSAPVTEVLFDLGDDSPPVADPTAPYTTSHQYAVPADTEAPFTITVTAVASDGGVGSAARNITVPGPVTEEPGVTNPTPALTLARSEQTVTANFAGTTAGSAGIARHEVNWGDGSAVQTVTEPTRTAVHVYNPPAEGFTYTVTVTAVAVDGGQGSISRTMNVPAPAQGGGTPVGTVVRMMAGNLSSTGFSVGATTTGGAMVRLVASTSQTMTGAVRGPTATPNSTGHVKASITGLNPDTVYFYALELGGGVYTARIHRLKTAPLVGGFKFAFASCAGGKIAADGSHPGMNVAVWDRIRRGGNLFFIHTGDMTYHNNSAASEAAYHQMYDVFQQGTTSGPMLRELPFFYTWSDHCFGPNNSYGTGGGGATARPFAQSAYRKRMPSPPLPSATGGIYHTFVIGRVRFIVADQRSYKTAVQTGTNMNPGKSMLGAEQKAWLKSTVTNSPEKYIVYVSDVFFSNANGDDDGWPAYGLERIEVADLFKSSGRTVEIISGDQHSIGYDDGSNSLGVVNIHAASINSGSSVKTVPLTYGPSGGSNQHGEVEVVDNGGSTIQRVVRLYNSAGAVAFTNTRTITVGQPTGDVTPPTAPSNLAAGAPAATSVPLTWTASTDLGGVTGYTLLNYGVEFRTGLTGTAASVTGLAASTNYVFTLKARDAAGNLSAASNAVTVVTPAGSGDTVAPTAPSNLAAGTPTSSSIPLTWGASTDASGVASYQILNRGTPIRTGIAGTATSVTLTGLTPNTGYELTVKAVDAAGNLSAASNTVTVSTVADPNNTARPYIAYTTDSYFRKKLPAVTPVSTRSAAGVSFVKGADPFPYPLIRGIAGNLWGMPYAMGTATDPKWRLIATNGPKALWGDLLTDGFHAPATFVNNLTGTSDSPLVVIDRVKGITVWAYQAKKGAEPNTIIVTNFGAFEHTSNGLDRRNPRSNSTRNERTRGVIPDSMMIRVDLLDYAVKNNTSLGHVLECFWVETNTAHGFCHPMVAEEGNKAGWGAEGERFRIKPGINLAARPGAQNNPAGLAIARTLQDYGAYLGDNSGSGSGIKTQQGATYPGLTANCLNGLMTWDDIEFLPLGWDD